MRLESYQRAMEASDYRTFANCFNDGCSRCTLSDHDVRPILYRGNPDSSIVLIGEAPGAKEDEIGIPFTGPAGQLLDKIMNAIGLSTDRDMLLTNVVYCRPVASQFSGKQNYTPKAEQIARCWPFTQRALELLKPKVTILCGRVALCAYKGDSTLRMWQHEGRWVEPRTFVMMHPAAILHKTNWPQEQMEMKSKVWEYMKYFRDTYREKLCMS